jgi:hypothetical protein
VTATVLSTGAVPALQAPNATQCGADATPSGRQAWE